MCDIETSELIAEFRKEAARFTPQSVLQWNGMSWDYLSIALSAPDVSSEDRAELVKFAEKALASAAFFQLGLRALPSLFKWRRHDRAMSLVRAMASFKMPPEPGPTDSQMVDFGAGPVQVDVVPQDTHRVERRRAIAAIMLLKLYENPGWSATQAEFGEIARSVGARVHDRAA